MEQPYLSCSETLVHATFNNSYLNKMFVLLSTNISSTCVTLC